MSKRIQLINLYANSFDDSPQYIDNFFSRYYVSKNVMCYTEQGKILSALHLLSKNLQFYDKIWRLPFIVGAATLKEYRNQGIFTKLLKKTFSRLASTNTPFVMLYPVPEQIEFYRNHGFVTVTHCTKTTLKYDGNDAEEIESNSERLLELFNGWCGSHFQICQYRNQKEMEKTIERWSVENIYPHTYQRNGKVCYIAMSDTEIEEVVGDVEVLNGVKQLDGKVIDDFSGADTPYVMARLISPIKLLENIEYKQDGVYYFRVVDQFFHAVNAMLCLNIHRGRATVTFGEHYDFEVSDTDLIKLAFGCEVDCPIAEAVSKKSAVFVDKY